MSKIIEALNKTIESYQKKADGITTDYGNINLTHRRAQQLSENQRKANKILKVVEAAKALKEMHENNTIHGMYAPISSGAQLELLLFGSMPTPITADTPEWAVKDKQSKFRLLKMLSIETGKEFNELAMAVNNLVVGKEKVGNSFSESAILLKYPSIRNIPGFNPTPRKVIDRMVELAGYKEITEDDVPLTTWEPQAGFGSIADVVAEVTDDEKKFNITCCEINLQLSSILMEKGYQVKSNDYQGLVWNGRGFDRVMMNPPFEKMQDVNAVVHCYGAVKQNGKLISVMSPSWTFNSNSLAVAFRAWLDFDELAADRFKSQGQVTINGVDKDVYIEMNPDGAFKSSFNKTGVSTLLISITKHEVNKRTRLSEY
jgi:hypothetical protein